MESANRLVRSYVKYRAKSKQVTNKLVNYLQTISRENLEELASNELTNIKTLDDVTAIHLAAKNNHTKLLASILTNISLKERLNLLGDQSNAGMTALHYAAQSGFVKSMQVMLNNLEPEQREEILKIKDHNDFTVLHYLSFN